MSVLSMAAPRITAPTTSHFCVAVKACERGISIKRDGDKLRREGERMDRTKSV
jgi:hypothetical protein